mgnify:CR=1 FL=1
MLILQHFKIKCLLNHLKTYSCYYIFQIGLKLGLEKKEEKCVGNKTEKKERKRFTLKNVVNDSETIQIKYISVKINEYFDLISLIWNENNVKLI